MNLTSSPEKIPSSKYLFLIEEYLKKLLELDN